MSFAASFVRSFISVSPAESSMASMVFPAPAKARLLDHTAAAALDAELDDALVLLLVDSLLLVHPVHHLRSGLQVLSVL